MLFIFRLKEEYLFSIIDSYFLIGINSPNLFAVALDYLDLLFNQNN